MTRNNVSRRSVLTASVGVVAATSFGGLSVAAPIQELTRVVTLEKLAAEGKFASVSLGLPQDHDYPGYHILLDGKEFDGFVSEVYAPGGPAGWAVAFADHGGNLLTRQNHKTGGKHERDLLIYGNWRLIRAADDE